MPINKCVSLRQLKKFQSGRVSERERIAVEGHLSTCDLCQYTINNVGTIDEKELQEDLPFLKNAITNRLFERQRKKRRQQLSKIAAALLFLVTMGFAVQFFTNSNSPGNLYEQYYQAYDVPDTLMRSASSKIPISAPLAKAIAAYKNVPYEKSTDNIPTAFDYNPEEAALTQLLKGLTFLEKGQTKEAIPLLKKAQSSKTKFGEDASWYLAMAHLKESNATASIQCLDQVLAIKNGFYYDKAKALKAQLIK